MKKNKDVAPIEQAVTTEISARVKVSTEINRTWYTIEYSEVRSVGPNVNLPEERTKLQDGVYDEVYKQIVDISESAKQSSN